MGIGKEILGCGQGFRRDISNFDITYHDKETDIYAGAQYDASVSSNFLLKNWI
jgi:hypothetical protein